jgi:hypothetical protein
MLEQHSINRAQALSMLRSKIPGVEKVYDDSNYLE